MWGYVVHTHRHALEHVIDRSRRCRHVPVVVGGRVADRVVEALQQVHVLRQAHDLLQGRQHGGDLRRGGGGRRRAGGGKVEGRWREGGGRKEGVGTS